RTTTGPRRLEEPSHARPHWDYHRRERTRARAWPRRVGNSMRARRPVWWPMSPFSSIRPSSHFRRAGLVFSCTALAAATISGLPAAVAGQSLGGPAAVPASQVNIWVPTGTMSVVRKGATATMLPDGDVLVAGGGTPKAELYDPATRSFSPAGVMSV